ncbi:hypothetical protein YN1HA_18840 [Sulfurisphaera ohwakuensis]
MKKKALDLFKGFSFFSFLPISESSFFNFSPVLVSFRFYDQR